MGLKATPGQGERTCPSARCAPGARVLGMVQPDGRVALLRTPLPVDEDDCARLSARGTPEAGMRFADRCVEGRCQQWTGHSCGVIERVLSALAPDLPASLPPCPIRAECRWYGQEGGAACAVCPQVVTDTTACAASG